MLRTNTAGVFIGCVFLLLQVRMEEALLLGERAIGERDSARAEADGLRAQLQDALARCVTVFSSLAVALAKTDHLLRQARNGHEKDRTSNTPNCLSLAQACSPDAICRCVQQDRLMFVQTKTIPLLIQASKANQRGATNRRPIVLSVDFACAHAASELEAQQEAAESATAKTLADAVEVARADAVAALTAQAQAEARSEVAEMLAKQQVRTVVLLAGTAVSELHADGSFIVCLFLLC